VTGFAWTVRVRTEAKRTVTVHARNHVFSIGNPLSFSVTDDQPCALELMLGAFAADLTATFRFLASSQHIQLDAVEFSASCTLNNPLMYVGVIGESGHPGIDRIEGTLYVAADADEDALADLWVETLRRSPLYNTLHGAVELSLRLQTTA